MQFDPIAHTITGPTGTLVPPEGNDEILRKLAMLIEGECEGLGPTAAATKHGYTKQRYYQLLSAFTKGGCLALLSNKPGPRAPSRRTPPVTREVVRHRFLDPDASADVIAQKIRQTGLTISTRSVSRVLADFGLQKKLIAYRPTGPVTVEAHASTQTRQQRPCDPRSIEDGVRQTLADKVSGNLVGLWLLIPEHLRLGTWNLLCNWSRQPTERVEPRLALQLVRESALCLTGLRHARSLRQRGFELANGLPFVASDVAIHQLLVNHPIEESKTLQIALGKNRLARGHFRRRVLIVDPHRILSFSQRQMRRHKKGNDAPAKVAQTFFCLDADTKQPIAFLTGTSARKVAHATPELLELVAAIGGPCEESALVVADAEHFTAELVDRLHRDTRFDLLVPVPQTAKLLQRLQAIPDKQFASRPPDSRTS